MTRGQRKDGAEEAAENHAEMSFYDVRKVGDYSRPQRVAANVLPRFEVDKNKPVIIKFMKNIIKCLIENKLFKKLLEGLKIGSISLS